MNDPISSWKEFRERENIPERGAATIKPEAIEAAGKMEEVRQTDRQRREINEEKKRRMEKKEKLRFVDANWRSSDNTLFYSHNAILRNSISTIRKRKRKSTTVYFLRTSETCELLPYRLISMSSCGTNNGQI